MLVSLLDDEIKVEVQVVVVVIGVVGFQDMGKVMGVLKFKLVGCVDMMVVFVLVKVVLVV